MHQDARPAANNQIDQYATCISEQFRY